MASGILRINVLWQTKLAPVAKPVCWHHRPIDAGSLHMRNAPVAEAALGRETADEEIGPACGVLRPAKTIFASPVLDSSNPPGNFASSAASSRVVTKDELLSAVWKGRIDAHEPH